MSKNWRKGVSEKPTESEAITTIVSSTPSENITSNPRDATSMVFFDMAVEFVNACVDVWPKDAVIKAEAVRLSKVVDKAKESIRMATLFHATLQSSYPKILAKDPVIFSLPVFAAVNAVNKYENSPVDVRNTVWEYLKSLTQYAGMCDMYNKCPQKIMDSISSVAGGLIDKLQSGEMDMSKINPMQIGQMMMQSMTSEDLESFGNAMMTGGNMESMMSLMQSQMGGVGAMGGMPDLSTLASIAQFMKPS